MFRFFVFFSVRVKSLVLEVKSSSKRFDHVPSSFGAQQMVDLRAPLVLLANSNSGCFKSLPDTIYPTTFRENEKSDISGALLLPRGKCNFSEKVLWAQSLNASAVIVHDNEPRGGSWGIIMSSDVPHPEIRIPAVFISFESGKALQDACFTADDLVAPIGPCFVSFNSTGNVMLHSQEVQ